MIENKLTRHELSRLFQPLLRLESLTTVLETFQEVLGVPIREPRDVIFQRRVLVTFEDYRLEVTELREATSGTLCAAFEFKARERWWHGVFRNQNANLVQTLQAACKAEMAGLSFDHYKTVLPADSLMGDDAMEASYLHDSRFFNSGWKSPKDISPLLVCPDSHHGNCFVEFFLDGSWYKRDAGTTTPRDEFLRAFGRRRY